MSPPCIVRLFSSESASRIHSNIKLTVMTEIPKLLNAFKRFAYGKFLHIAFTDLLDWTHLRFKSS
jgi:hypothetical protein